MSEENLKELAESIARDERLTDREKLDKLLFMNADIQCNLGIDSTKGEKENAKLKCRHIYRAIKIFDEQLGSRFLYIQKQEN